MWTRLSLSPGRMNQNRWHSTKRTVGFTMMIQLSCKRRKINELIEQFEQFSAAFIIEEVTDYSQYGLDDPVCTIEMVAGEETYNIKLGDYSSMDSQRYVSIGDGNVYLATSDPMDYFDATLSDMILHDDTPSLIM